ncbi:hypothetical protein WMZ97_08320 [Lentibacillus sp. N15]|uniref:hypothetical protein n=1 Tax=Lentibacillus songyuanensis TaxID=3136161 RepID=UPI0031BB2BC5
MNPQDGTLLFSEVSNDYYADNWLFSANVSIDELVFQPEEVIDAMWVNKDTYETLIQDKEIVPTLHHFFLR